MNLFQKTMALSAMAVCSLNATAQTISENTIYTLNSAEILANNGLHGIKAGAKETSWVFFTERAKGFKRDHYAIVNGKQYGPFNDLGGDTYSFYDFPNSGEFFVTTKKGDERYLSSGKNQYGPYKAVYLSERLEGLEVVAYADTKSQTHIYLNGKEMVTIKDEVYPMTPLVDKKGNCLYGYTLDDRSTIFYNNKNLGTFDMAYPIAIANGHYAFLYTTDIAEQPKYYYNIDGKEYGPYAASGQLQLMDDGKVIFDYTDFDQVYHLLNNGVEVGKGSYGLWSLNNQNHALMSMITTNSADGSSTTSELTIDGKNIGVFSSVGVASYSEKGFHHYYSTSDGVSSLLYVDGQVVAKSPIVSAYLSPSFSENEKHYAFSILDESGLESEVYVDGKSIGKFHAVNNVLVNNNGDVRIDGFDDMNQMYMKINGTAVPLAKTDYTQGGYTTIVTDPNFKHILSYDYLTPEDVMIDGKFYEGKGGVAYTWNAEHNSFQWMGVEGTKVIMRELTFQK